MEEHLVDYSNDPTEGMDIFEYLIPSHTNISQVFLDLDDPKVHMHGNETLGSKALEGQILQYNMVNDLVNPLNEEGTRDWGCLPWIWAFKAILLYILRDVLDVQANRVNYVS